MNAKKSRSENGLEKSIIENNSGYISKDRSSALNSFPNLVTIIFADFVFKSKSTETSMAASAFSNPHSAQTKPSKLGYI